MSFPLLHELSTGHGLGVPEEVPHQLRHFIMLSRGSKWLGYRNLAETNNLLGNNCKGSITSARNILHNAIAREDKIILILRSLERYRKPMCKKKKKINKKKNSFFVYTAETVYLHNSFRPDEIINEIKTHQLLCLIMISAKCCNFVLLIDFAGQFL